MGKKYERILVVGNGKSGTTALYFRIKKSLQGNISESFEPGCFDDIEKHAVPDRHMIVKILLPLKADFLERSNNFFNKKILIIRDPRDIIISTLLYTGAYEICWKRTPEQIHECMDILRRKEADPSSISAIELLKHLRDENDYKGVAEFIAHHVSAAVRLAHDPSFFIFKYEDLIADKLSSLEEYLKFSLTSDTSVDRGYSRVVRSKTSGSWKDWFLEEDMVFFRPLFEKYIEEFDYDPDWTSNVERRILPRDSSEYFERIVNERRTLEGLIRI